MQQAKQQLFEQLRQHNIQHNMPRRAMRAKLERLWASRIWINSNGRRSLKIALDDFCVHARRNSTYVRSRSRIFAYRLRTVELLERRTPETEIEKTLGPAPWDVLNEAFQAAEFAYRVVSPLGTKLLDPYELLFEDAFSRRRIKPSDLSSGEKTLLGLVVWLYNSQHHGRFPAPILARRVDAHLHPSMTRHLLNVIKDVFVDRA